MSRVTRLLAAGLIAGLAVLVQGCEGATMNELNEGDVAPDFALPADDGRTIRLADFRDSRVVVLYFYPRDETPGCTREACGFRDASADYERREATVLGVSVDSVEAHRAFKEKENLNFTLLSDSTKEVSRRYGVLGPLGFASRVTFLIGKDGRILRIFREVDPSTHAGEILAALALTP